MGKGGVRGRKGEEKVREGRARGESEGKRGMRRERGGAREREGNERGSERETEGEAKKPPWGGLENWWF